LFVPTITAFGQLTAPKPLPSKVPENTAVTVTIKGKPGHSVSAVAVNGAVADPGSATLPANGQATFTVTFTASPGILWVSDTTDLSVRPYEGKTTVTAEAAPAVGGKPAVAPPAVVPHAPPAPAAPAVVIQPVTAGVDQITVTGGTAGNTVAIFSTPVSGTCSATSSPVPLDTNFSNVIDPGGSTPLKLKDKLTGGEILCAVITQPAVGKAAAATITTAEVTVATPPSTAAPSISPIPLDQAVTVTISRGKVPAGSAVALFSPAPKVACTSAAPPVSVSGNLLLRQDDATEFLLSSPLSKGSLLCAILTDPKGNTTATAIITVGPVPKPASTTYTLNPIRVMGGIDVSASASTDPAAKFLLDGTFEVPITTGNRTIYSPVWIAADVRLSSITQPGQISQASSLAAYVKPLTDSSPSQLVQSGEISFATEFNLLYPKDKTPVQRAMSLHLVTESGVITPLSPSQANPTIYTMTQQLYSYYTGANPPSPAADTAVTAACGATFSTTTPCYIAYLPQGRTRFYRSWDGGLRLRFYDQGSPDSNGNPTYLFPSAISITAGQNEYVTGGEMRGFVLHAGGTLLVPAPAASSLAGFLYVYGAIDLNLNGKNQNSQEFLLQQAGSSANVTTASSSVAVVSVASQIRDRYRFGVALDVAKLITILTKPKTP
jgi:hypothetical protein